VRTVRLKYVARPQRNVVQSTELGSSEVRVFSIPALDATGGPEVVVGASVGSDKLAVRPGDVLISRLNPRKSRVCRVPSLDDAAQNLCSPEFVVLRPAEGLVDQRFFVHFLRSSVITQALDAAVRSVTRSHQRVEPEAILDLAVPAIPGAQQRAIADFLDRECKRIADLRYRAEQLMRLALATHWELAAQELLAAGPSEHQTIRLKYLVEQPVGGAWGMEVGADEVDVVVARVADFDRYSLCVAEPPTARSVSRQVASRLALRIGDLLLEKSGGGEKSPVGFVARYEGQPGAIFSNFLARVRPLREVDSVYLKHLFGALYATGRNIPCVRQVTGIQNLDVDAYLSQSVPARSPERQSALALRFEHRLERAEKLRAACERLDARLSEYRDALITEAVTGQLDVTRLSEAQLDESARAAAEGEAPEVLAG